MRNVGILLFDDVELLDFAGPYEVFSVTSELNDFRLFNAFTISISGDAIKSVNGLKIIPDFSIDNSPEIDILVISGGVGTKALLDNDKLQMWICEKYEKSEITFSVCSGARLLAKAGLLDNVGFITHHEVIGDVLAISPEAVLNPEARFVDNGKIMTSAGISAGIDLSLHIVEKLHGKATKEATIKYLEYGDWKS